MTVKLLNSYPLFMLCLQSNQYYKGGDTMVNKIISVITDADLKLNEKIAINCGYALCWMFRWHPRWYRAFRHSLRSGRWSVLKTYKLVK